MGGNLFKTERMSRQEYQEVCLFISGILKNLNYAFPASFLDKEDFGDVDIIVSSTDAAKSLFYESGCVTKIDGTSLLINYKGKPVQVDLIESSNVPYSTMYYSYGMFGAMVGKLFKSQGFKLREDGLCYIYNGNEVFVTSDWQRILYVIGIHKSQFSREEEAFRAIVRSSFFMKRIFTDLPQKKLEKAMKRPMYSRFLEYIKDAHDMTPTADILGHFYADKDFIRRLQCEDITAKANSALSSLIKIHYPYEDFKARCPDLTPREVAREYNLLKGYLRSTLMSYFNDRSSQIQRPLSDSRELDMHIFYFGYKVDGVDFKYLPLDNLIKFQGIQQCRVYQERYMSNEDKDQ